MRRLISGRLAIAVGCALATAIFSGVALAGNGNGNSDNAPGQQKKDEAAQAQVQLQAQQQAAAQSSTSQTQSDHQAPGQAKKADVSASASADTEAGVKPSSTTTKWTHCRTGGVGTGIATCTAEAGTPATKADVSKLYGNGKTAAQIAVSRGAPDGTLITGPGNSQPHKVTACGKPNNKSGGVDVHAVKSYDASACQAQTTQSTAQVQVTAAPVAPAPVVSASVASAPVAPAPVVPAPVTPAPATQGTSNVAPTQNAGGVLGANATIVKPKPAGGVLGTVSNVSGSTLPFTGFPVWVVLLVALGLIAAGLTAWRRGAPATRS
jgi:hypothetical protein